MTQDIKAFAAKINSQRRSWQPNNPSPKTETAKWSDTISRCLALTDLEPAVAEFIQLGLDRSDATKIQDLIPTLQTNITDEIKHETALTRAKQSLKNYNSEFEFTAKQLISRWRSLSDNPITIAAVLENGVFFIILPLYSLGGSASLRITSNSISQDERIHVQSHRAAAQLLKAPPSKQLNKLRVETIDWLSDSLLCDRSHLTKDRLLANSQRLMQNGVSDLIETQAASVNAPFELSNNTLDKYAA